MIRTPETTDDWFNATALLHDYVEWLRAAVGVEPLEEQPSLRVELADLAAIYDGRTARLFLAFDGPLPVGMIAVRHHPGPRPEDQGTAELKRMYVRPVARGKGLADALIDHVIEDALRERRLSVWLETMRGVMDPAIAVYRRNRFEQAEDAERTIALDGMVVLERTLQPAALAR